MPLQVDITLLTVRMSSTVSGMSLMTSMSQRSMRRLCRTRKPMCYFIGDQSKATPNVVNADFFACRRWLCFSEFVQEEQWGVGAGAAESRGPGQYEGAQPAAVLHLQRMAEQVQHICWTRPHQQSHISLSAWRHVFERLAMWTHTLPDSRTDGFFCTGIPPNKYQYIDDLVVIVPQNVWEYLYNR